MDLKDTTSQHTVVPIKNIIVSPGRGRRTFTRIEELAESIKENGFINPMLCAPVPDHDGFFELIAGERRFRGAVLAGLSEVPITFRANVTPLQYKILELEENVGRVDLSWDEEGEIIRQIDELRRSENPNWQQKQTAELMQLSEGHVSKQIKLAKRLKEDPSLRAEIRNLPLRQAEQVIDRKDDVDRVTRLAKRGEINITTDLRHGSCIDLIKKLPTASVDLLLTDPPYGLELLEDLRENGGTKMVGHQLMSATHNLTIDEVLKLLRSLAPEFARVLKPGAHFYVFCAFQHAGEFIKALAPLDFKPPVVVWDRGKATTPGYGYNYLNRLEYILYGCNPPWTKRLAKNMWNVLEHPEVPRNLRCYPTEKPQSLLKDLISQSTIVGDVILDPFAGSASTLKAARALKRKSLGFEIDEDAWKRAQLALQEPSGEPTLVTSKE